MPKPPKVTVEVRQKQGSWVAIATFAEGVEVKGSGITVAQALWALADAVGLYFEHVPESPDA